MACAFIDDAGDRFDDSFDSNNEAAMKAQLDRRGEEHCRDMQDPGTLEDGKWEERLIGKREKRYPPLRRNPRTHTITRPTYEKNIQDLTFGDATDEIESNVTPLTNSKPTTQIITNSNLKRDKTLFTQKS